MSYTRSFAGTPKERELEVGSRLFFTIFALFFGISSPIRGSLKEKERSSRGGFNHATKLGI
jgi:hypothetical protein